MKTGRQTTPNEGDFGRFEGDLVGNEGNYNSFFFFGFEGNRYRI
jgi:hypothetical protein